MSKLKKPVKKVANKSIKKSAPVKKVVAAKPKAAAKKPASKIAKPVPKKTVKAVVKKAAKPTVKKVTKPVAKAPVKTVKAVAKKAEVKKAVKKATVKVVAKKAAPKKVAAPKKSAKKAVKKVIEKPVVKAKTIEKPVAKPAAAAKPQPKPEPVKVVKPSIEIMQKNELPKLSTIQTTHSFTKQKVQPAPSKARELNADGSEKLRYSDKELEEFRELIVEKIKNAKAEFQLLQQQLNNANDNGTDDTSGTFKMLEDGSETLAKEEAAQLAARQRKFIEQLENALIRIKNKTFGICRVTGKLIPKDRLRAVPHTTQSIEAKLLQNRD